MGALVALVCVCGLLAGCTGGPQGVGITGPGAARPAAQPDEGSDPFESLGNGGIYAPNMVPTTGGGRYWGYN